MLPMILFGISMYYSSKAYRSALNLNEALDNLRRQARRVDLSELERTLNQPNIDPKVKKIIEEEIEFRETEVKNQRSWN